MDDFLDVAIASLDYGFGAIKVHRFFEWSQSAHERISASFDSDSNLLWVYAKHRARWARLPHRVERIRFRTWLCAVEGNFATREFTGHDASSGKLLFERQTKSVALDRKTLRPAKADLSHLQRLVNGPSSNLGALQIKADTEHPSFSYTRAVEPDDVDRNAHVNNAVYLRWATDAISRSAYRDNGEPPILPFVREVEIRYLHPLKMGAHIYVEGYSNAMPDNSLQWKIDILDLAVRRPTATIALVTDCV